MEYIGRFTPAKALGLICIWIGALTAGAGFGATEDQLTLHKLAQQAIANNQKIKTLKANQRSALEKSDAAGYWPDPMIGGNYFGKPIETRLGKQKSNIVFTQPIPWPGKTSAKENQLKGKAEALQYKIESVKQSIILQVKTLFYEGFVLQKRLDVNRAESNFLEKLAKVALSRVRVGKAGQGDVIEATLEISRLEADTRRIQRDLMTTRTKLNAIINRPSDIPIAFSRTLHLPVNSVNGEKNWQNHLPHLRASQPDLLSARASITSAEAGLKYSKLKKIPDLKASFSYFVIDEDNPMTPKGKNEDAWAIGAAITIPLWWGKYSSYEDEAFYTRQASIETLEDLEREHENRLADLWQQALTSKDLIKIYEGTIIPQADQVLEANQSAYRQGGVTFDRVIGDFRRLLVIKVKYFREQARFATLVAKVEKTIGRPIVTIDGLPKKGI
jgi:outer membrane protein TolC